MSTVCIAFHTFIVGENKDFKFGTQVDHSKFQPIDDKVFYKHNGYNSYTITSNYSLFLFN